MKLNIIGKNHFKNKNGKDLYVLHATCDYDKDKEPNSKGVKCMTGFTTAATYNKINVGDDGDYAVFFEKNGITNIYLKKGE